MPRYRKWTDGQFIEAVKVSYSIRGVLQALGLSPTGANYKTVHSTVARLSLDTSHFRGQAHLKGRTHNWASPIPLESILVKNSTYHNLAYLKKRLVAAGLLNECCCICELTEWRGQPLSLVLDHINGDNTDHRIENLRFLCPNCNSQQETFAGRNKARKRAENAA